MCKHRVTKQQRTTCAATELSNVDAATLIQLASNHLKRIFGICRMWIQGLPKGLQVLPKHLECALLTTELAAKTCHDTGSGKKRLSLRSNRSHVSWFYHENVNNNQTDNVAITKNCRKGPNPSLEWRVKSWNMYLAWPSLGLKPVIRQLSSNDPQRWTESAEAESAQQCKDQAVLRENPSALRRQTMDSRLLTMKRPYCWCGDAWKWISKSIAVV